MTREKHHMPQDSLVTILAVDTSTQACSVALIHEGKVFSRHEILPQKHAHRVLEMVDEVLVESSVEKTQIDLLAYGEGPGAFTGVRIASGVIQGLALGWDKPVLPVSTLYAMAEGTFKSHNFQENKKWCAFLDARMGEVYLLQGKYIAADSEHHVEEPVLISPKDMDKYIEDSRSVIGLGDLKDVYPELAGQFKSWYETLPNAVSIARIAQHHASEASSLNDSVPTPLYLRNRVADTIEERKLKKMNNE